MSDDRNALHVEQMDGFVLPPPDGPPITVFDMITATKEAGGELTPEQAVVPLAVPPPVEEVPQPTAIPQPGPAVVEQPAPVAAPAEQEK